MTIGVPSVFSFQGSSVTDSAITMQQLLANCQSPVFQKGLEIRSGEWVYEYQGDVDFTPKTWNATDEADGVYQLDEILFKDCSLIKVVGKSGTGITYHQTPKEPEEYGSWDTDMNPATWTKRYVRMTSDQVCGWLEKMWQVTNREYFMTVRTDVYTWHARDCDANSSLLENAIRRSQKYNSSTDIKATITTWGLTAQPTVRINSMVERSEHFYLRTSVDAPLQYNTWTTGTAFQYSYMTVLSPADIDGFVQKRMVNALCPFDGKNYSKSVFDTSATDGRATWTLINSREFDMIGFGRIKATAINIRITDPDGVLVFLLSNYGVDNSIDNSSTIEYATTLMLYTNTMIPVGYITTISLEAPVVEIGEITPASKLDAGFTNLEFNNTFKDFSPQEQDQWGNWYYIDGVRVHVHTGTVDFPLMRYDQMSRLMILIGGQKVLIDGSDALGNVLPDGKNIFASTMMIARFTKFDLATSSKNKRIGDIATYSFNLEELV